MHAALTCLVCRFPVVPHLVLHNCFTLIITHFLHHKSTHRYFPTSRHLVTSARIHVFSSVSQAPPLTGFAAAGWNATFLPCCKGGCFASVSLRDLNSRERGPVGEGRAGRVIDTPRLLPPWLPAEVDVAEGEGARGRFLFSAQL